MRCTWHSTSLLLGCLGGGLAVVVGWLAGGRASGGIPVETWFMAAGCLGLGWQFYYSITVTPEAVVIRPATLSKIRLRIARAHVVIEGCRVTDGQPIARSCSPEAMHFAVEFTDYEATVQEIIIWHKHHQLEHGLSAADWPDLRAALLAMGSARQ